VKSSIADSLVDIIEHFDVFQLLSESTKRGEKGLATGNLPHILDAMTISKKVWFKEMKDETIINCWIKAAILPEKHEMELKKMSKKWSRRMNENNSSSIAELQREEEQDVIETTTNALVETFEKVMAKVDSESKAFVEMRKKPQNHLPLLFQDNVIFGKLLEKQEERGDTTFSFNSVEKEALQKWLTIEDDSVIQDFLAEELEKLEDNHSILISPEEMYSDDDVDEEPVSKKKKVSRQSVIDRFDDLISSCAERNLTKTIELLKKALTAFKSEDTNDTKPTTSIQMTLLDCYRAKN
jgi:hypothetical protein